MANVAAKGLKLDEKVSFIQPNGDVLDPNNLTARANTRLSFADGITEGAINRAINMRLPVVLSGTMSLDLLAGTYSDGTNTGNLVDKNGAQVTLSKVKLVKLEIVDEVAGITLMHLNAAIANACLLLAGKLTAKGNGLGFGAVAGLAGLLVWADPNGQTVDGTHKIIALVNDVAVAGHIDITIAGIN